SPSDRTGHSNTLPIAPYLYLAVPVRPSVTFSVTLEPAFTTLPASFGNLTLPCFFAVTLCEPHPEHLTESFAPLGTLSTTRPWVPARPPVGSWRSAGTPGRRGGPPSSGRAPVGHLSRGSKPVSPSVSGK